ncbi:hypothetical protein J6590_099924 [Homalodisca vitripennis]|nr:hypothetical protein J6590_099924 [Homalodisca vitripennis]
MVEVISVRPLANPTSSHALIGYPDSAAILFVHNRETNHLGPIDSSHSNNLRGPGVIPRVIELASRKLSMRQITTLTIGYYHNKQLDPRIKNALNGKMEKLRAEMQVVLDHSINSDGGFFNIPKKYSSTYIPRLPNPQTMRKRSAELEKIIIHQTAIRGIHYPQKSAHMKLRGLEANNQQLKNERTHQPLTKLVILPASTKPLVKTRVGRKVLFSVIRNKRRKNKARGKKTSETVTVMGDSHVSGRTEFEEKRVRTGTKIRGACKPGGGLLDVSPTCSPPPDQCYVLMVGTNDVDDGREGVISSNLESLLTSCKVLLIPLTTRYDLSPTTPFGLN